MNKAHLKKLIDITGSMEHIVLNMEQLSRSEVDSLCSGVYVRMTEVVGAIMLEQDEMSGAIE